MRGAPSTVRPFRISTLAGMVEKPDSAWVSSLRVAALAPIGARLAARVELLAFMTLTEPATTDAGARSGGGGGAGQARDALVLAFGRPRGKLVAEAAIGAAVQLDRERLGGKELQRHQALGLAGALRLHGRAAGAGGLGVELAERLADRIGGGLGIGGVDLQVG